MEKTNPILDPEELQGYKQAQELFSKSEADLAWTTSQLSMLESRKLSDLANYNQNFNMLDDVKMKLTEKYGQRIRIDMSTGEVITPSETDS
jgi:hypothetical protein